MKRIAVMQSTLSHETTRSVLLVLLLAFPVLAQNPSAPPTNQTQTQSNAAQRTLRVARISLLEGDVNYQRGGDKQNSGQNSGQNNAQADWFDATINTALEERDQLFSGRNGRAELQLNGRTLVRLDRETNLRITQFNTSTVQLSQAIGTATYRVDNLDRRQFQVYDVAQGSIDDPLYFEVDTPAVAITFAKEGLYRINVRDDGTTELIVRKGQAEIYNQELGTIQVKSGRRILIEGRDVGYYQIAKLNDKDEWDRWNDRRDDDFYARTNDNNRSSRYVPVSVAGSYDLDAYGDWYDTPDYGYVWSPRNVNAGWAPYRQGAWRYHNTWGWTWTSYEPWGWAPYHYGRWNYYQSRWCWTPYVNFGVGRVGIGFWDWSPHLVAFFGSGGSYNRGYNNGYYDGYRDASWTGWCPLGFGERWGRGYYDRGGRYGGRDVYINNTYINHTTIVRNVDGLRNYESPNGVGGMDGRRFENRRVQVDNNSLTPPPRGDRGGRVIAGNTNGGANNRQPNNQPAMEFARPEVFRPTQNETGRALSVERNSPTARALEAPVIVRRNPYNTGFGNGEGRPTPVRPSNIDSNGAPIIRTVDNGIREAPSRNNTDNGAPQVFNRPERRVSNGDNNGNNNSNNGGFRPVERIERPVVTRPATEDRRTPMPERKGNNGSNNTGGGFPERNANRGSGDNGDNSGNNSGTVFTPPRERRMPADRESPSRTPERSEQPRQIERREAPQRAPERSAPPRESAPSRAPERMERPERQAPPPRDSAPAARPERPSGESRREMPSRKTEQPQL